MNAEHLLQTCNRPWVMKHHTELSQDIMAKSICLDGKEMTSFFGILTEFADKFEFPNYFGFNFNALDEMLADLEWFPRSSYIVVIRNGDYLLRDERADLEWFYLFWVEFQRNGAFQSLRVKTGTDLQFHFTPSYKHH